MGESTTRTSRPWAKAKGGGMYERKSKSEGLGGGKVRNLCLRFFWLDPPHSTPRDDRSSMYISCGGCIRFARDGVRQKGS